MVVITFSKNENPKDSLKLTFGKSRSSFLKEMFERLGGYPNKFFDFCGAEKIKKASIAGTMHSLLCEVYISVHCLQCENIYIGAQLARIIPSC